MSPNAILGGIRYSITSVKETGRADASVMDKRTEVITKNSTYAIMKDWATLPK